MKERERERKEECVRMRERERKRGRHAVTHRKDERERHTQEGRERKGERIQHQICDWVLFRLVLALPLIGKEGYRFREWRGVERSNKRNQK